MVDEDDLVEGETGQTDATSLEQIRFFEQQATARAARERELWRWVLTQKMGREFLHTVVFATLGHLRHLPLDGGPQLYGDVALHNLACRWLGKFVVRHRDLYLQMLAEASKRDEDERQALEAMRASWRDTARARGERV